MKSLVFTISCLFFGLAWPLTSQCQTNLTACINEENLFVVRSDPVQITNGLALESRGGYLIPASGDPDPFQLLLINTPRLFNVADFPPSSVAIDELVLTVGYEKGGKSVLEIAMDLDFVWSPVHGEPMAGEIAEGVFCTPIPGDLNLDRAVDRSDIDLLGAAISSPVPDFSFDLNNDDQLNQDDLEFFLHGDFISDGNKLNGDADFSGFVGFPDFLVLSSNFGQDSKKWSEGDFVANGRVDFEDFLMLSANFARFAQPVPEPSGFWLFAVGLGLLGLPRIKDVQLRSSLRQSSARATNAMNAAHDNSREV